MNKLFALSTLVLTVCSTTLIACGGTSVPVAADGELTGAAHTNPSESSTAGGAGFEPGGPLQPAAGGDTGSSDVTVPPSKPGDVVPGGPLQPAAGGDGGSSDVTVPPLEPAGGDGGGSDVTVPPFEPAGGFGGNIDPGGPIQLATGGVGGAHVMPGHREP